MEKFKTNKKEGNKKKLLERLGPLSAKLLLLLTLASLSMEANAQEHQKLDGKKFTVKYENNIQVPITFGEGVDYELKEQGINFIFEKGMFSLEKNTLSFDDPGALTDSVKVNEITKEIPGGSKISNLVFTVYNNDGTVEYVTVDDGDVVDYKKTIKE